MNDRTRLHFGLLGALVLSGLGCTQQPTTVPVRSLERSGAVSFVCLGPPTPNGGPGAEHALDQCGGGLAADQNDFEYDPNGKPQLNHIYGLVTQTTRGEVAVVDLTVPIANAPIVDEDRLIPGNNFLPVGAQPVDIVSTPGGTASFVTVAEIGREGIFGLPSARIRPHDAGCPDGKGHDPCNVPDLSSWPACRLPAAPGDVLLINDPLVPDLADPTKLVDTKRCPGALDATPADTSLAPPSSDPGNLDAENQGRQKLAVTLPDAGYILIIDAETLLERPQGSFDACPVDNYIQLRADVPPPSLPPQPTPDAFGACANAPPPAPISTPTLTPRPSGIAYADGRLYVGDLAAPVIHVLELSDNSPCHVRELAPLLPSSIEEPTRIVTTSRIAVSNGPSAALKNYLYAIDVVEGSTMIFDISANSTTRTPLVRAHPEWDPFQARDRISFLQPAQDVAVITRDVPQPLSFGNAVAPPFTRCDADPKHLCDQTTSSCDYGVLYRTSADFTSGAIPGKLRGTFGFILLSTGGVVVTDIDDLDAPCRLPNDIAAAETQGCPPDGYVGPEANLQTKNERSCNVVLPNSTRSAFFVLSDEKAGRHEPGVQALPLLFDNTGTLLSSSDAANPRMVATIPKDPKSKLSLAVGIGSEAIGPKGDIVHTDGPKHALAMNLEDPRAQVVDQVWNVTFEGALPGFQGKLASFRLAGKPDDGIYDPNSRFCDAGVESEAAVLSALQLACETDPTGGEPGECDATMMPKFAAGLADYVQIGTDILPDTDLFWKNANGCSYQQCRNAFGPADVPQVTRDLRVLEAYQDHLLVERRHQDVKTVDDALVKCCFPSVISFNVRAGQQWVAVGESSGFIHHVIAEADGRCRNSCDAAAARRNSRARTAPNSFFNAKGELIGVLDGNPRYAFINPMFRYAIISGKSGTIARDEQFRFGTEGSFTPLVANLAVNTSDIQPQSMTYLSSTGEVGVPDGSLEGLLMMSLSSLDLSRQFF